MANKAIFFDRDGVLNRDVGYLHRVEEFIWMPGAQQAVALCNRLGYLVFVVTNQSGVARGYYMLEDVRHLHYFMQQELRRWHAHIDAFAVCPHYEQGVVREFSVPCTCRKPQPGMIIDLIEQWGLKKSACLLIGDKESDMEAAYRAGIDMVLFQGNNLFKFIESLLMCGVMDSKLSYMLSEHWGPHFK